MFKLTCNIYELLVKYTHGSKRAVYDSNYGLGKMPKNCENWRKLYECLHN